MECEEEASEESSSACAVDDASTAVMPQHIPQRSVPFLVQFFENRHCSDIPLVSAGTPPGLAVADVIGEDEEEASDLPAVLTDVHEDLAPVPQENLAEDIIDDLSDSDEDIRRRQDHSTMQAFIRDLREWHR